MDDLTNQPSAPEPAEPVVATQATVEGQGVVEPTKPEGEVTPAPKMFTEEQHKQVLETLKGGHKGTVSKMRADYEQAMTRIADLEAQQQEGFYSTLLRGTEDAGGNVDFAKAAIEFDKKARASYGGMVAKERELALREVDLNEAAIGKTAYDLLSEHKLGAEHLDALVNEAGGKSALEGKLAMENLALKLAMKSERAAAVTPVITDKGGGKPAAPNLSHMSESEQTGWALDQALSARK